MARVEEETLDPAAQIDGALARLFGHLGDRPAGTAIMMTDRIREGRDVVHRPYGMPDED